jgi:hypothetical protein
LNIYICHAAYFHFQQLEIDRSPQNEKEYFVESKTKEKKNDNNKE